MRQWKWVVSREESGETLEQVLKKHGFSKKEISRLKFKNPGMQVDGNAARSTQILQSGQVILLNLEDQGALPYIQDTGIKARYGDLKICYEDSDLLVVEKPSGLSCHSGRGHFSDNLGTQVQRYCEAKGEMISVRLIGRLDKDTSGGVVFAKNQAAASRLWKEREEGIFEKEYQALVHGKFLEPSGAIRFSIREIPGEKNRMQVSDKGKQALTYYQVQKELTETEHGWKEAEEHDTEMISLVKCRLKTGRTHQIRVHMAAIGHPVVGDPIYGRKEKCRLCLHAGKIRFRQPFSGEIIEVEIPIREIPFC